MTFLRFIHVVHWKTFHWLLHLWIQLHRFMISSGMNEYIQWSLRSFRRGDLFKNFKGAFRSLKSCHGSCDIINDLQEKQTKDDSKVVLVKAMNANRRTWVPALSFLTSALDGCESSALRHDRFTQETILFYPFSRNMCGPNSREPNPGQSRTLPCHCRVLNVLTSFTMKNILILGFFLRDHWFWRLVFACYLTKL
jgi:hypothetical protein